MRILLILIFLVISLSALATYEGRGTNPESSIAKVVYAQAGSLTGAVAVVRKIRSHLSADRRAKTWSEPPVSGQGIESLAVGDVLPERTELYIVPRHESYRYAIVPGRRLIVDAASRQIVYIVQ